MYSVTDLQVGVRSYRDFCDPFTKYSAVNISNALNFQVLDPRKYGSEGDLFVEEGRKKNTVLTEFCRK